MEASGGEALMEAPVAHRPTAPEVTPEEDMIEVNPEEAQEEDEARRMKVEHSQSPVDGKDEASRLRALATDIRDQDELERDVGRQVCPPAIGAHDAELIKL